MSTLKPALPRAESELGPALGVDLNRIREYRHTHTDSCMYVCMYFAHFAHLGHRVTCWTQPVLGANLYKDNQKG